MKRTLAALLIPVAFLLVACGGNKSTRASVEDIAKKAGMTDSQFLACEDLISGAKKISAEDKQARLDLARKVNEWAQKSGPELKDAGDILARAANTNADGWKVGADTFAAKCQQLGWPKKDQLDAPK